MSEKKVDLKAAMPLTAKWVAEQRALFGDEWVTQCIKRAMAGEACWFYAMESGHKLGTPFTWDEVDSALICKSLATGAPFFGVIRPPVAKEQGVAHGTN